MELLPDTHIFLWYTSADSRLPAGFKAAIQDISNHVYLSAASIWEAVIKSQLGKLPLPAPTAQYLRQQRIAHQIESLPIDEAAMESLDALPMLHRDPFDRLIAAQAIQHGLTIVTVDPLLLAYPIQYLPRS